MDLSEYKDTFVSEARDHMDILNAGLLDLEKDSSDDDLINKLFRSFHTLKGNSATMGFMKFSELAHILEDLFSNIRDKKVEVNQDIMDVLFEGCDILEEGLDIIEKDSKDNIEIDGIVKEVKDLLGKKEEKILVEIPEKVQLTAEERVKIDDSVKHKHPVYRIVIIFDNNSPLKLGKVLILLRDIKDFVGFIKTTPEMSLLKKGKFNNEIELIISSQLSKEELTKKINQVSGIKYMFILGIDDSYKKPKEMVNVEKETEKANIAKEHKNKVVKQVQGVKVNMEKLDSLMNLIGEMLISNILLQDINNKKDFSNLDNVLGEVDRLVLELQDEIMEIRMVPIGNIFNRFPRMVRDLAKKENKQVNLLVEGGDIEFDRTVLDEIGDPLVHLLRNSVDHGIDLPEKRVEQGKPEAGLIKLIAKREKNSAVIEVTDDGAGINPEAVKISSIKKGIITSEEAANMTKEDLLMLVFRAGVSTNDVVTEISGRGVGMDVVLSTIKSLGGTVKLISEVGKGTTVRMKLPLTVAIITGLLVKVDNETYILPLSSVDETVDVKIGDLKRIKDNRVFLLRNQSVPIFWLSKLLHKKEVLDKTKYTVVVVNINNEKIGLVVDKIISQQQILIKSLYGEVKKTPGISGATILGDGSVALILDINSLL